MKQAAKCLVVLFLASLALPLFAMDMPKGMPGTWTGIVTGNHCAVMGMKCPLSHVKLETPVFVPLRGKNPDFTHIYYFVGLPKDQQEELFGKEVKISGLLYPNFSSIWAKSISVKEGKMWKAVPIQMNSMGGMKGSKSTKNTDMGY